MQNKVDVIEAEYVYAVTTITPPVQHAAGDNIHCTVCICNSVIYGYSGNGWNEDGREPTDCNVNRLQFAPPPSDWRPTE